MAEEIYYPKQLVRELIAEAIAAERGACIMVVIQAGGDKEILRRLKLRRQVEELPQLNIPHDYVQ